MKKVAFYTLGCKVNQYETNAMEQEFLKAGYEIIKKDDSADIYVINTCTVTNVAERKSRQMLRRAKQINPNSIVVVCGCYAEIAKKEIENIEDVDIIINDKEKANVVEIVEKFEKKHKLNNEKNYEISDSASKNEYVEYGSVTYTEKNRAVIKIQDGCNMFCSYCIIPYARGRIRSRKIENIVDEIKQISAEGVKEVVLTGIHIASYGKDFENEHIELIDLLEEVNKIDGIERIRLGSLEPTIITPEFISKLVKLEKICEHFHLSLQSGCDATLKRMNRKYTAQQFKEICNLLKKAYPDVHLTTDIIVGFPGENDEEFNCTYNFLKEINFYKMHIFKYSKRKGTVAEKMPNQVNPSIKEERSKKLIELSNNNEKKYNEKYIGKTVKVLFEEIDNGYIKGHTSNYMLVKVKNNYKKNMVNEIIEVEITNLDGVELIGKIL